MLLNRERVWITKESRELSFQLLMHGDVRNATKLPRSVFDGSVLDESETRMLASGLARAGVGHRTVQALMGHNTKTATLPYAHLAPQHPVAAIQRLCDTGTVQESSTNTRTETSQKSPQKGVD
jgi:hypothetical protein